MSNTETSTSTSTFGDVEVRKTTETVHFTFGPVTTHKLEMRKVGQEDWVLFVNRLD